MFFLVKLSETKLDPLNCRKEFILDRTCGGLVSFEGVVRLFNHNKTVDRIEYSAFEALAVKEISRILEECFTKWPVDRMGLWHRIGVLPVGETAVVLLASAKHRAEAFAATEYAISQLKKRAPIWKKEYFTDGSYAWGRCSEH